MRLVLFGSPGAGKGTQGALLAQHFAVPHIAMGDIIRDHIARGTEFGKQVEAAIAAGNFAPDEDILYWVFRRLAEPDAEAGYILDGFPRDLAQAGSFRGHNREIGQTLDAVVELLIAEETLIVRLAGRLVCPMCKTSYQEASRPPQVSGVCDRDGTTLVHRPDDDPSAIKHRFEVYRRATVPLRDFYRKLDLYVEVDANGTAQEVFERICIVLKERKEVAAG